MCGIVGTVSERDAAPVLLSALRKLEYRGYDSAGIATGVNSHLEIRKGTGKLEEVEKSCRLSAMEGKAGIGHVRWATHGGVNTENAHPHADCKRQIAVVHNGIIENYRELKEQLAGRHTFRSETDTEVIAHLIEESMQNGVTLDQALLDVTGKLKGSYAILAISSLEPQKIAGARRDSPLVIGKGKKGNYLASDILCLLDETDQAIYVEDGEVVTLTGESIRIMDSEGREVQREPVHFNYRSEDATKQGHDFFMCKEILEQPQSIRRALSQDKQQIMDMAMDILRARQVVLTACGTSRHAALVGRYVFSKLAGKFSEVVMASEFQYFSDSIDKNTLVIAISQSGETADVLQGIKKARENGARIFSLVNMQGSTLARMSDQSLYLNCGPELCVAATKSFLNQLAILYLLAFAMENRIDEGIEKLKGISYLIEANLKQGEPEIAGLARELRDKRDFYYLGRGINFAIAGEGALKLKEIAYVHAEGMPAGELKHGTLALIESGTPVLAICPGDYTFEDTLSNVLETKARGAYVVGVSDVNEAAYDKWIQIPKIEEIFYPLISVIPLQQLAYYSAIYRGYDPDRPRNLAKSVTVK
ncbi:MAG: glutamine--fructose-6-phosphate transaminase (isomerizing) [Dehalococcoidales bacterium]|nr:glutamine--fructose-6-phosphate transaminase (isomerizing) [Dehalococcoidales bacterium]